MMQSCDVQVLKHRETHASEATNQDAGLGPPDLVWPPVTQIWTRRCKRPWLRWACRRRPPPRPTALRGVRPRRRPLCGRRCSSCRRSWPQHGQLEVRLSLTAFPYHVVMEAVLLNSGIDSNQAATWSAVCWPPYIAEATHPCDRCQHEGRPSGTQVPLCDCRSRYPILSWWCLCTKVYCYYLLTQRCGYSTTNATDWRK